MKLESVTSSNVAAIGYDADTRKLHVQFTNGSLYEYDGVGKDIYRQFMDAESKGKYLQKHIKSHTFRRLDK